MSSSLIGGYLHRVNSKATLRLPLDSLLPILPSVLHDRVKASRFYAANSDSIVVQSDNSRKPGDNVDACFRKLHEMIVEAGKQAVPGATSQETKSRVKRLYAAYSAALAILELVGTEADQLRLGSYRQAADKEAKLRGKKFHSSKKASRSGRGSDY